MKRSELKRKTPLARTDGFRDSDGKPLIRRAELKRTELKPGRRKTRVPVPSDVRRRALGRTKGRCVRCGERATDVHHVLPRRLYPELVREEKNLVGVCRGCHDEHERAHRRLTQRELGKVVWAWCMARDRAYMRRTYPI